MCAPKGKTRAQEKFICHGNELPSCDGRLVDPL